MNRTIQIITFSLWMLCLSIQTYGQCAYGISNSTDPTCTAAANGVIQADNIVGASYLWNTGATTQSITGLIAGTYSVTITDALGCVSTDNVTLTNVGINITLIDNNCDGNISVDSSINAAWPYTYIWSTGETSSNINYTAAGTYTVTLVGNNGCVGTASTTSTLDPLQTTEVITEDCNNTGVGAIDVTVTGGSGNYSYDWFQYGQGLVGTTEDLNNLYTNSYHLKVLDLVTGCQDNLYYYVPTASGNTQVTHTDASCGQNNGSVTVTYSGTGSGATYAWSNGATTATISNLAPGNYIVTTTVGGCSFMDTAYINGSGSINGSIAQTCDELEVNITGGTAPYTYLWATGETTQAIQYTTAGTYDVTVTDVGGCQIPVSYTVSNVINPISSTGIITHTSCGNDNGAIDLSVTGGSGTYTYAWTMNNSNAVIATTEDISSLDAGTYHVQINDTSGCTASASYVVDPNNVSLTMQSVNDSCGTGVGSATVVANNMVNPTYLWNTGATTSTISGLATGTYDVTVTDVNCVLIGSVNVQSVSAMTLSIYPINYCPTTGINVNVTGGVGGYSYAWSNGGTAAAISGITAGTYTVTVTDANGCQQFKSYTLDASVATPLTATFTTTNANCSSLGNITVTPSGGTAPYTYDWSSSANFFFSNSLNVGPGTYSVIVEDAEGCSVTLNNIVIGGGYLSVNTNKSDASCGQSNGSMNVTISGTSNPIINWYEVNVLGGWTLMSTGSTSISGLAPGIYGVEVIDGNDPTCVAIKGESIDNQVGGSCISSIYGSVYNISASMTCTPNQYKMKNVPIEVLLNGNPITTIYTNGWGNYNYQVFASGTYTFRLAGHQHYVTQCPASQEHNITVNLGSNYTANHFYLVSQHNQDLVMDVPNVGTIAPGQSGFKNFTYCNVGATTMTNGTINYTHDPALNLVNTSYSLGSPVTGHTYQTAIHTVVYNYSSIEPGECGSVNLAFSANTSVQSGDLLCGSTTVNPMIGDETPSDNFETTCFQVVNSYDPNEKLVSPYHTGDALSGGMIYEDEEVLTYTIHFQNLGTGPAYRVVVRDTLDANLLPESIKNVSFSHDGYLDVQGNVVSFVFDSIMLAPASQDWLASNGQIKFDINRTAGLPLGTEIKNNAAIYFDFNPAIITNETVSFIGRPDTATISVEELDLVDLNMEVFPNPFKENFDLVYTLEQNTSVSIHLYNTLGELVQTYQSETAVHSGEHSMNIQTNGLSAGLYMLRLETDYGSITKKLIKQ